MEDFEKSDNQKGEALDFEGMRGALLEWMRERIPEELTYHRVEHTEDVLRAAERIANEEGVRGTDLLILQTAAILHDSGFGVTTEEHEEVSCELARRWMSKYGYAVDHIDQVCEMIQATKLPQNPKGHLAEILCDADLDYLGRDDFWPISERLFREFLHLGVVEDEEEWNRVQLRFFESHSYFTETARDWRNEKKAKHLAEIKVLIES